MSALQLQLWLAPLLLDLPAEVLSTLGLDKALLEQQLAPHAEEVSNYRKLRATGRLISQADTAEILRCQVNSMSLSARTPAELAAVARAVKALPDWVWDDVIVAEDGPPVGGTPACNGEGSEAGTGRPAPYAETDEAIYLRGQDAEDYMTGRGAFAPQLNRAQRRAMEARERGK